jgi:hypothetical protein
LVVRVQSSSNAHCRRRNCRHSKRVCFRHRVRYFINPTWSIPY